MVCHQHCHKPNTTNRIVFFNYREISLWIWICVFFINRKKTWIFFYSISAATFIQTFLFISKNRWCKKRKKVWKMHSNVISFTNYFFDFVENWESYQWDRNQILQCVWFWFLLNRWYIWNCFFLTPVTFLSSCLCAMSVFTSN